MALQKKQIFGVWFSTLGDNIGLDLFSYNYSFRDYLKRNYNETDAGNIAADINLSYGKKSNFFIEGRNQNITLGDFIKRYEVIVRNRGYSGPGENLWEYDIDVIKRKLPPKKFNIDTKQGKFSTVLLLMNYIESKYSPQRLNRFLETNFEENDNGLIREEYFGKLKRCDFSFLPKGSDKDELEAILNSSQESILQLINSEIDFIRKQYGLNSYEKVPVNNHLQYKNTIIGLAKPKIRVYGVDVNKRFRDECKRFKSVDNVSVRDSLSKKEVSALFFNKDEDENSPVLSLSGRIKQKSRIIKKLVFKSVDFLRKDRCDGAGSRIINIDDFVISDIPGIMFVYDSSVDLHSVSRAYYTRPYLLTVEDKPNKEKEGYQRQTKLIHSPTGIILDVHERDPRGLFFCHFGPESQEHYELHRHQRLSQKERELMGEYESKLDELFSGIDFTRMC